MTDSISSTIDIAAPPEKVWAMVSDLPRMGEWSPENAGGTWKGDATGPSVGAKFAGKNKNGRRVWSGPCTITEADAPKRIAWAVAIGPIKGASWSYDIEASATGSRVTQTWTDTRSAPLKVGAITKLVTGQGDRAAYAQELMDTTLANIKKAAEGSA